MGMLMDCFLQSPLATRLSCEEKQWNDLLYINSTSNYFLKLHGLESLKNVIFHQVLKMLHAVKFIFLSLKMSVYEIRSQTLIKSGDLDTRQLQQIVNTHNQKQVSRIISNWMCVMKPTVSCLFKRRVTAQSVSEFRVKFCRNWCTAVF